MGFFDFIYKPIEWALNTRAQNKNISFQRDTNQQMIDLTREAWAREDMAVQRRAQDLAAAGMNPVLAAGSAATTQGHASLSSPRREQVHLGHIDSLVAMDNLRTSKVQRDLISAQADEHRARADSIRQGTSFNEESWNIRLETLEREYQLLGDRGVLLQLQQENTKLKNEYQESDNLMRAVEAEVHEQVVNQGLSKTQGEIVRLEVENYIMQRDQTMREEIGIPSVGSIQEKGFQYIRNRVLDVVDWMKNTKDNIIEGAGRILENIWQPRRNRR